MQTIVTVTTSNASDLLDQLAFLRPASYRLFTELKQEMDKNNVAQRPTTSEASKRDYTKRLINDLRSKDLIRHCPTIAFTSDSHLTYPRHSVMLNPYLLIPVDAAQVQSYWDLLKDIKR